MRAFLQSLTRCSSRVRTFTKGEKKRERERTSILRTIAYPSRRFYLVLFRSISLSFARTDRLENKLADCVDGFFFLFLLRDYLPAKSTRCTLETVSDGMLPSERPACTKVIVKIA